MSALRFPVVIGALALLVAACTGGTPVAGTGSPAPRSAASAASTPPTSKPRSTHSSTPSATRASGGFTMAFAGDVHFSGRVRSRLDHDPATVFAEAAAPLRRADLTMVNLETAITTGGVQQNKEFTFRAPGTAFTALRDAGVDVATMANNHGADYGMPGLRDSLRAARDAHFPVVGIGADATQAYAPYTTTLNGVRVAIIAADQVQDETTLRLFSAGVDTPGVANAYSDRLITAVRQAKAAGYVVVVYVHWGIEYHTCPSGDQQSLASKLAAAGASAVIGTHAHVLQGAGWLTGSGAGSGTYVAYGLGNYLWWMSFGNQQDDNGILTLTFHRAAVVAASFAPSHLDNRGVPLPATGAQAQRITDKWQADRRCTSLSGTPPR